MSIERLTFTLHTIEVLGNDNDTSAVEEEEDDDDGGSECEALCEDDCCIDTAAESG